MTAAAAFHEGQLPLPYGTKAAGCVKVSGGLMQKGFLNEFKMLRSEDEFFALLCQRLTLSDSRNASLFDLHNPPEGLNVSGGSPQSTLGGNGSWSGRSSNHNSPPATPFESKVDTLGLIYAAAGQVASCERNTEDPLQASFNGNWRAVAKPKLLQPPNAGFYADLQMKQKYIAAARQANEAVLFWEHHLQNMKTSESKSRYGTCSEELFQSAWPALQQGKVVLKPNFQAVPLQRKESAGTGVFIPRRYESSSALPPRKSTVASCAQVPSKVVQALNTSIETMSASRPHCNPVPRSASLSQQGYDALMAGRQALLDQQQRSMARRTEDIASRSLEACLPQEWSY